jgi:hypothetical protein
MNTFYLHVDFQSCSFLNVTFGHVKLNNIHISTYIYIYIQKTLSHIIHLNFLDSLLIAEYEQTFIQGVKYVSPFQILITFI